MLTRDAIKSVLRSLFAIESPTDSHLLDGMLFDTRINEYVTDGGTAATEDAETVVYIADRYCKVKGVKLTTTVAVADDAANTALVTVGTKTGAGATRVAATWDTTTGAQGALAANVPADMALSATPADLHLAPGDQVTVELTKANLGVAVAAATGPGASVQITLTDGDD